jgi:hypothetical protein
VGQTIGMWGRESEWGGRESDWEKRIGRGGTEQDRIGGQRIVGQEETEHAVRGHAVEADRGCGADPDPGNLSEYCFGRLLHLYQRFFKSLT